MFSRIKSYIIEVRQEFQRVNWPTKQETIRMTVVVVGLSIAMSAFLGVFDILFRYLLEKIIIG